MAWNTPTLSELISRVEADFSVRFFGTSAPLQRSTLKVLARVWAMVAYLSHLYLGWIYNQAFAHLADPDQLQRHGQEIGLPPKSATFARGVVDFSGLAGPGGITIPAGTLVQSAAGVEYQTEADTTMPEAGPGSGECSANVVAVETGPGGNLAAGSSLSLVTPIAGVILVSTLLGISGGSSAEAPEAYRDRILFKKQNPPQGGAASDYIEWATTVSPVTDAWVFPNFPEANSVTIRVADRSGISPTVGPSVVADVLSCITDPSRKPLTADVRVGPVNPSTVAITAQLAPLSSQVQASALAELRDLFLREGVPASIVRKTAIQNALANTPGVVGVGSVTLLQDGLPVTDAVFTIDQVAGTVGASFVVLP